MNYHNALVNICFISLITGLGYGFVGTGKYMNAVRLLSTMWIISVLLETAVYCIAGGN